MKSTKYREKTPFKPILAKKHDDKAERAVALRYKPPRERAPRIVAKGSGNIAREIINVAKKYGIPIKEDSDLVEVLSKLELEQEIPEKLYGVIAEVLAFVYRMNRELWQRFR